MLALSRARLVTLGLALFAATLVETESASAQCLISGPDMVCGGGATLCGPPGDYEYDWTLPDGTHSSDPCVVASGPGTYSLRLFDFLNGLFFGPCSHTVSAGAGPEGSISGATSGCLGTPVELCGPDGALAWQWSGPAGFSSTSRCVSVSASGSYSLVVLDPATGCASPAVAQDVTFADCRTAVVMCPRPACFWGQPCPREGSARRRYDGAQLAAIATCVDQRAASLSWDDPASGFCSTMNIRRWNARKSAKRQFAAVLANVCAAELGMTPRSGSAVGLDAATTVQLASGTTTVGAWLSSADATLMSLEGASLERRAVRRAYRELISAAWAINHGLGMDTSCNRGDGRRHVAVSPEDEADFVGDESLELALADDEYDSDMQMRLVTPNPTASNARLAFSVSSSADEDVVIAVYDLTGRKLRELVNGRLQPGYHETEWDGRIADGSLARNGVYFVMGQIGGRRVDARVTLLR